MNDNTTTNTPDTLAEMLTLLEAVQTEYSKFYNDGNLSAGTRVRKAMQTLKASAQDVRTHVQATKNSR